MIRFEQSNIFYKTIFLNFERFYFVGFNYSTFKNVIHNVVICNAYGLEKLWTNRGRKPNAFHKSFNVMKDIYTDLNKKLIIDR